jgi:hypothetical protein
MNSLEIINKFSESELRWLPEIGIGYYPVKSTPYNAEYFERYMQMKNTPIGVALNQARVDLVNRYVSGSVLDIGIGNGAFVESGDNIRGYDINPVAVKWLVDRRKYLHPFRGADALTFWDSLEHIHNPQLMLQGAKEFVFVSMPIYKDLSHLMSSKHRRYDEHCWYFTEKGCILFMSAFGFECLEINNMESDIGREDIGTFVFKRVV